MNSSNKGYSPIKCGDILFDVQFHPKQNILCAGLINGEIELHKLNEEQKKFQRKCTIKTNSKSIKGIQFSKNGKHILTGSSDKCCTISDITGKVIWKNKCHEQGVSAVLYTGMNTFASADENGIIKHWDIRNNNKKRPINEIREFDDYVSSMISTKDQSIIATSAEYLGVFDIVNQNKKLVLNARSDEVNDELLCSTFVRCNTKLVCGTCSGYIAIFSNEDWGMYKEKFKVCKNMETINSIVKLNETLICVACGDGTIKTVQLYPHKVASCLAKYEDMTSVEKITINKKKDLLASITFNNYVQLHPVKIITKEGVSKIKKNEKSFFCDL